MDFVLGLRIAGTNNAENEFVKMGAHHTLEINLQTKLTITKPCWDLVYRETLDTATDVKKSAEVGIILIEPGMANFYLLTSVLAKDAGRVTHTIPKASLTGTNLDKAKQKFFQKIYDMMKSTIDFALIKCVVLGGPGEIRTEFLNWLQKHVVQTHDSATQAALKHFVNIGTKDIHRDALNGLLTDDKVKNKIANTKCAQHARAFDDFQKMLANDETRAVEEKNPQRKFSDTERNAIRYRSRFGSKF